MMGDQRRSPHQKQINFLRGWPNPSLLPLKAIANAAQSTLSNPSISIPGLLYGPDPGYQPLREEIAKWLNKFYRAEQNQDKSVLEQADPERICITGGASQNLACILQVFTDPVYTKRVWMVAPCYFLACRIFGDAGLKMAAVPEGKDGIDLEYLEKRLEMEGDDNDAHKLKTAQPWAKMYRHVIYCVPTFSNPSGKSMTLSRRQKLVQLARKHDALIVTDDVYDFLQWPIDSSAPTSSLQKALLPRLVDIDRTLEPTPPSDSFGNAASNGSFSKIAGPGVRTGWAEASPRFIYGLSQCGSSRSGGAPSQLTATIISQLLSSGDLDAQIETIVKPALQRRHRILISAIQKYLAPLGIKSEDGSIVGEDIFGGYFVWLELPKSVDAEVVSERAKESENLIVPPGKIFEVWNDSSVKFENSLRLCFSWEEEADLEEGVSRLAKVVSDVIERNVAPFATGRLKRDGNMSEVGEFK